MKQALRVRMQRADRHGNLEKRQSKSRIGNARKILVPLLKLNANASWLVRHIILRRRCQPALSREFATGTRFNLGAYYPQARIAIIPTSPKNSPTEAAMPVYAAQR